MARKPDKSSTRQQVFAYLDKQLNKPRGEVVDAIQTKYNIDKPYAATLYQAHRAEGKKSGQFTEIFVVRDSKDGKRVDPYISTHFAAKPGTDEATTLKDAKAKYEGDLKNRITKAKKL